MEELPFEVPENLTTFGMNMLSHGLTLGWNALTALLLFIFGFLFARFATRLMRNTMNRANFDPTLTSFFTNLLYYGVVAMVTLAALSNLGVETTQFIAVIGAAGLAIGLALEGALSNFAAGVLIIVFRPFRVGDYIEAADAQGFVVDIEMVVTVLRTLENETIVIPNSEITGAKIKNMSKHDCVMLEIPIPIPYNADLDTAFRILQAAATDNPHILSEPAPKAAVTKLDKDCVMLQLEVPIKGGKHEDAEYSILERIKRDFDAAGIKPPRPYVDVNAPGVPLS